MRQSLNKLEIEVEQALFYAILEKGHQSISMASVNTGYPDNEISKAMSSLLEKDLIKRSTNRPYSSLDLVPYTTNI